MNTEPTTLDEMGARVSAAAAETAAAMAAATDLMRRAGEEVQEAAATMEIAVGHLKRYQPPASDRPSGAARRRAKHTRLRDGITRIEEKAGIPRGRQGVKRNGGKA